MATVDVIKCCLDSIRQISDDIKDAIIYLDAGSTESFQFIGAFPLFLELGARAVCSLENMSILDGGLGDVIQDAPKTIKNPRHVGGRVKSSRDFKELIRVIHLYVQVTESIILKTTCQGTSLMLGSKAERSWKVLESRSRTRSQNEEPCGRMVPKQCDRIQWTESVEEAGFISMRPHRNTLCGRIE